MEVDIPVSTCSGWNKSVSKFTWWGQQRCRTMQTPWHFLKKQQMQVCIDLGFRVKFYLSAQKTIKCRELTRKQTNKKHSQLDSNCHSEYWFDGGGDVHILGPSLAEILIHSQERGVRDLMKSKMISVYVVSVFQSKNHCAKILHLIYSYLGGPLVQTFSVTLSGSWGQVTGKCKCS